MALDSVQKRMSALNPSCPWRGPLVDAAEAGFTEGNRAAAAFMYSGLIVGGTVLVSMLSTEMAMIGVGR